MEEGAEAKAWHPGTISNILKNQAYIGNMVQGKRRTSLYDNEARHTTDENDWIVVENTHEAIVDKELLWIRRWKRVFSYLTGERICL